MSTSTRSSNSVNTTRLRAELDAGQLDAVVATSPENTFYLSGVLIRTQITIRDRLAVVVWPRAGAPVFIVCNIEESLARAKSDIEDLRTYVEFSESPIHALMCVLTDLGLAGKRVGVETRHLSAEYFQELVSNFDADFVSADDLLESTRAIKTEQEVERLCDAFLQTEEAWTNSFAGETERDVSKRMIEEVSKRGSAGVRHLTLASGENLIHPHIHPTDRRLCPGDLVLTDFGAIWDGYSSDMARMGVVGEPNKTEAEEYRRYRESYIEVLHLLGPGTTAAEVYDRCARIFSRNDIALTSPHVGHSVGRGGGHEHPILHPGRHQELEPGMLIALEPIYRAAETRRYHLEDLVLITERGSRVITDWESTQDLWSIPG